MSCMLRHTVLAVITGESLYEGQLIKRHLVKGDKAKIANLGKWIN